MRLLVCSFVFMVASAALAGAQITTRSLTIDDRFRFVECGSPLISPDGSWVLYTRTRLTLSDNQRHTTTALARADGDTPPVAFLREGDRVLTWTPDSRGVFFFRSVSTGQRASLELFEQAVDDTAAQQRTHLGWDDVGYNWQLSRDGTFFLLVRSELASKGPGADLDAVFVDEGSNGQTRNYWSNLWRYDLGSGEMTRVTSRDWVINSADLSPDGRSAIVAARPDNGRNTHWKQELYLVDLGTGAERQVTHNAVPERDPRFAQNPRWFPDGRSVLFTAARLDRWENGNGDLWKVDVATGKTENITPNHTGRFVQPVFSPDGASILVGSGFGTTRFPVQIDVASGKISPLIHTTGVVSIGSWSDDRRTFAYRYQDGSRPPDVFVGRVGVSADQQHRITDLNPWVRTEIALGSVQLVRWRSVDGLQIEGLLTLPPGPRPRSHLPLIVHLPCGPGCGWLNEFSLKNQLYAGLGYAQLSAVVRGSSNYDDRFMQANRFDIGGGDLRDVLSGVDAMVARGIAHADSLALDGWSYGAVLGGYALTKTTRFKAASLGAMVSDWIAEYGAGANYDMVRWFIGGTPWSNPQKWRERSSLTHANRVRTPTLLHHGDDDQTDWPFHSMNYFVALRDAGTPARLIRYPGEGHDLQQPRSLRVRDEQDVAWMERFVRGIKSPETWP